MPDWITPGFQLLEHLLGSACGQQWLFCVLCLILATALAIGIISQQRQHSSKLLKLMETHESFMETAQNNSERQRSELTAIIKENTKALCQTAQALEGNTHIIEKLYDRMTMTRTP